MDENIHKFYPSFSGSQEEGLFYKIIALHENPDLDWQLLTTQVPILPRGWFELSRLPKEDRIEFTKAFWLAKLPLENDLEGNIESGILRFFDHLDDIGIFLTKLNPSSPFEVHMVYSRQNHGGFLHGFPPASKEAINNFTKQFGKFTFSRDYLAFLEIHDGFCKYTDRGIIKTKEMAKTYLKFQSMLSSISLMNEERELIDAAQLIPFYESFELHCYQCFYADWHPNEEGMGNFFFSVAEKILNEIFENARIEDPLAFNTFMDWLVFYLEDVFNE